MNAKTTWQGGQTLFDMHRRCAGVRLTMMPVMNQLRLTAKEFARSVRVGAIVNQKVTYSSTRDARRSYEGRE